MLTWYIAFLFSTKESLSLSHSLSPSLSLLGNCLRASYSVRSLCLPPPHPPSYSNSTIPALLQEFNTFYLCFHFWILSSLSLSLIMCYKHDGQSQAVSQGKACLFPRYIMITFKTSIIISYFLSSVPISSVRLIVSTVFDVKTRLRLVKWSQLLESALYLCFVKPTNGWQWTKNNDNDNNDRDTVNNLK